MWSRLLLSLALLPAADTAACAAAEAPQTRRYTMSSDTMLPKPDPPTSVPGQLPTLW